MLHDLPRDLLECGSITDITESIESLVSTLKL